MFQLRSVSKTGLGRNSVILLRELINEVNHIGTNINQIVHNNNSGLYSDTDKEQLVAYMRKLNVEVNKVYEVISERMSGNM